MNTMKMTLGEVQVKPFEFDRNSFLFVMLIFILQLGSFPGNLLSYIILFIFGWRSKANGIKALSVLVPIVLQNMGLTHATSLFLIARWLIFLPALGLVLFVHGKNLKLYRWSAFMLLFGVVAVGSIFANTESPGFGIAKLAMFLFFFFLVSGAFDHTSDFDYAPWFYSFAWAVAAASLPLYFSKYGYIRSGGSSFQGIMGQPNGFGVFISPFVAWLGTIIVISKKRPQWHAVLLLLILFVFLIRTQSRTSLAAVVISFAFAVMFGVGLGENKFLRFAKRVFITILVAFSCILIGVEFFPDNPAFIAFKQYVWKSGDEGDPIHSGRSALYSRQEKIDQAMDRFRSSPLYGTGFGIDGESDKTVIKLGFLGSIPVSGSSEKGSLLLAILSDTGLLGLGVFAMFIGAYLGGFLKKSRIHLFPLALSVLMINLGESMFFAPGGLGLHVYLMMGFARNQMLRINVHNQKPGRLV